MIKPLFKIVGDHDQRTREQLLRCVEAEDGATGVLCADGHLGYSMPIGGVVGYLKSVSPSGVGYDIACGNMAVRTNIKAEHLNTRDVNAIADEIQRRISFGIGRKNNEPIDSPVFDRIAASPHNGQRHMLQMARNQLGTVGSGNHYVDVLEDKMTGWLWVACHFGSRGFGHKTATGFMNLAQGRSWDDGKGEGEMDAPPLLLNASLPTGQDYIEAMTIAGEYAYAGREAVVAKVLEILGATAADVVHNHHNFAWRERHFGEDMWVVRKGATPAFPGQYGFVGGSMGDISVILRGVDGPEARDLLHSTVHGAGRVMSRTQAAGKQRWIRAWCCLDYRSCEGRILARDCPKGYGQPGQPNPRCPLCGHQTKRKTWVERDPERPGLVNFEEEKRRLTDQGIVIRGAGADEAPPVYRPLRSVLAAHASTIDVMNYLFPRIVVMAGGDEHDPYKD